MLNEVKIPYEASVHEYSKAHPLGRGVFHGSLTEVYHWLNASNNDMSMYRVWVVSLSKYLYVPAFYKYLDENGILIERGNMEELIDFSIHDIVAPLTQAATFQGNWDEVYSWLHKRALEYNDVKLFLVYCPDTVCYVNGEVFMSTPAVKKEENEQEHKRICGVQVQDILVDSNHVHVCWQAPAKEGHELGILTHKCNCGVEWVTLFKKPEE